MTALPPSPAEMNRRHREFWEREREKFERRVADPQLLRAPRYKPTLQALGIGACPNLS
jgi:hypothetical protein